MDIANDKLAAYIGQSIQDLPTPALILDLQVLKRNTTKLLQDVKTAGVGFRAHVKTLKSVEVVRIMLGGVHTKIVVSTLREIRGVLPLVQDGTIDEILYGLPCYPGALAELHQLSSQVKILLMVDNEAHVEMLEQYTAEHSINSKWNVFVKIDMGSSRAGVRLDQPRLKRLVERLECSPAVNIYGFYCHAGHSYGCRTREAAATLLQEEISAASQAADLMQSEREVVISVGATPTAHVIDSVKQSVGERLRLELHAGNYPANDLQQVATGSVGVDDQALRVLGEVCSVYPERNEAIINAGVIALSREAGPYPGFARVVGAESWNVGRLSQEHGILVNDRTGHRKVDEDFVIGQKVLLHIQHACITAAAHHYYFIVDGGDIVTDVWYPWKGW